MKLSIFTSALTLALFAPFTAGFGLQHPTKVLPNPTRPTHYSTSLRAPKTSLSATTSIGIIGGGTVGGGIISILTSRSSLFTTLTGSSIKVSRLAVRDLSKSRDFTTPQGCVVTDDLNDVINDPEIDTVVEVMGGTTLAKDAVFAALKNGKNVVTANKAMIAAYLPDLEELLTELAEAAKTSSKPPPTLRYEAAVCGGIPIISSMKGDYVGDEVEMITGIINGCTNYMLTNMDKEGLSYDESLKGASDLGYAEADPTLDVGGFDARSKLKILMRLAFGISVPEDSISCEGITELTKEDFEYAAMLGGTVKLLAVAKRVSDTKIAAFVSPAYVANDDVLASIAGATNAVEVVSKNLGSTTYSGQGAGRYPTANSCINDIVRTARGDRDTMPFNAPAGVGDEKEAAFVEDYKSKFYIRLRYKDQNGITADCGSLCEKHGIGIYSILQNPIKNRNDAAFVITTDRVELSRVEAFVREVEGKEWTLGETFFMPILRDEAF